MYVHLIILMIFRIVATHAIIPSDMKILMDPKVDPCENFYKYSCGGWLQSHSLQPHEVDIDSSYTVVRKKNREVVLNIMKEHYPIVNELWQSCLDLDKINKLGNRPLQKDLNRIINTVDKENLMMLAGEFARVGNNVVVKYNVRGDGKDSRINTLYMEAPDLTLPSHIYLNPRFPTIEKDYRVYIDDLMKLSRFRMPKQVSASDIVIRIEKQLVRSYKGRDKSLTRIRLRHVLTRWPTTIGSLLHGALQTKEMTIPSIFVEESYLDALTELIESTLLIELKVYVAFLMVHSRIGWLGNDFNQLSFSFFQQRLKGIKEPPVRETICINRVIKYLPDLIGDYFYSKSFDATQRQNALIIMQYIQEAMEKRISHSTWLNTQAQNAAQIKLNKVAVLLGNSSEPRSHPSALLYDDFPANMYTILSHAFDISIKKLGQFVNRKEWLTSPATVNAFYSPLTNTLTFPAAILQPPIFNGLSVHPARNFGAIGFVMGHELTHGFDPKGRLFDGDGNYRQLWNEVTSKVYDIRTECMIKQYSTFEVHGEHGVIGNVNGNRTLSENVADNGGIALAWDAYRKYMKDVQPETHGVTSDEGDQMLFLSYAQIRCSKTRDKTMEQMLAKSHHSPNEWRVNGIMINNDDFAKVFNCKANTPMNPLKKCHVW